MKYTQKEMIDKIVVKGNMKQYFKNYYVSGYKVEVNGVKFFSPEDQFISFILGDGEDKYKTKVGDDRYKQIEEYIKTNILHYVSKSGSKTLSSFGLKHMIEYELGFYVSNETVKVIMALADVPTRANGEDYPINIYYPYSGIIGIKHERKKRNRLFHTRRY